MGFTLRITLTRERSFEIRASAKLRRWCPACKADSDFVETDAIDRTSRAEDIAMNAAHYSRVKGREYLCLGSVNATVIDEQKPN